MTRRERIAARLMTFAAGVLITTAALGQDAGVVAVQTATMLEPKDTAIMSLVKATLDDPAALFVLKAIVVVGLISGVTEGFRRRFAQLREDTDRSKVLVMSTALGIGAFLGLVGLAPAVPAFTGWPNVQGVLGGVTCGLLTAAGVSYLKGLVGMREEKRAAAGQTP